MDLKSITSEIAWNEYEARAWADAVHERGLPKARLDENEREMVNALEERCNSMIRSANS